MLDEKYWDQRYKDKNTPWDMPIISPPLKSYFDQIKNKDISILIPGFGRGRELIYLEKIGFTNITGIDVSDTVIQDLKLKLNHTKLIKTDFFSHEAKYDLIIEQTFFCALDPSLRTAYVKKMHQLLKDDGKLVGLLFNREFESGPPFGGSIEEYKVLFEKDFKINVLEESKNSYPGRIEVFINFSKNN